jgi:hypothetical protein
MPNPIKYSTGLETNALKKGNFYLGTGDVEKGPTSSTGYYSGINPPNGGYTVYVNKALDGPSIITPSSDAELIGLTNSIAGQSFTSATECLVYYASQNDKLICNIEYPQIITNGLVLNVDAGFTPSYPTSGVTWYDVSVSNINGTLINGPTFNTESGGNIVFDGVDDYVNVGSSTPSSLIGNPSFSIGGWFKRSGDWSNGATWGIGGDGGSQGINSWNFNNTNEISIDLWGTSTYTTNQTYSSTEWKYIIWTYNGSSFTTSNIIIYINGTPYTGPSLSILRGGGGTPNINSSGIVLGRAGRNTFQYYGKPIISTFLTYNRVLSSQEVLQNYNATKSRYGL